MAEDQPIAFRVNGRKVCADCACLSVREILRIAGKHYGKGYRLLEGETLHRNPDVQLRITKDTFFATININREGESE